MRVTQKTLANSVIQNLNSSMRRMNRLQEQLYTGKAVNRPSDDPAGAARIMILDTAKSDITQYRKNIDDTTTWLNVSDSALGKIEEALIKVRDTAVQGGNGTRGAEELEAIASTVDQTRDELIDLGNQTYQDRFLFAGTMTKGDKPFQLGDDTSTVIYQGNEAKIDVEFSQGQYMTMNVSGTQLFGPDMDAFQTLADLSGALRSGDQATVSASLDKIDQALDRVLSVHTEIGARVGRLEMSAERFDQDTLNIEALTTKIQDTDIAQAMTDLKLQENGYRMALSAGARVIQPTLIDFLR